MLKSYHEGKQTCTTAKLSKSIVEVSQTVQTFAVSDDVKICYIMYIVQASKSYLKALWKDFMLAALEGTSAQNPSV